MTVLDCFVRTVPVHIRLKKEKKKKKNRLFVVKPLQKKKKKHLRKI